jgi:hypothetical protein
VMKWWRRYVWHERTMIAVNQDAFNAAL